MTATVYLQPGKDKPVRQHHPWIFSGAVARVEGQPAPGDLVEVADARGEWLARGYYNASSQIVVRLLTWRRDEAPAGLPKPRSGAAGWPRPPRCAASCILSRRPPPIDWSTRRATASLASSWIATPIGWSSSS